MAFVDIPIDVAGLSGVILLAPHGGRTLERRATFRKEPPKHEC